MLILWTAAHAVLEWYNLIWAAGQYHYVNDLQNFGDTTPIRKQIPIWAVYVDLVCLPIILRDYFFTILYLIMFIFYISSAWFFKIHIFAAWLRAASDGGESVPATAGGSQQGGKEEREEARWVIIPDLSKNYILVFWKINNNCFRWSLLLWSARTDPQFCQVESTEGEGAHKNT